MENKTGVRFRVRKGALRDCYEKILGDEQMKSKANNVASRLLVIILAICITAGCCPAFSVAEADDVTVASAALSAFNADGDVLVNKRADGERLQIDGSKQNHTAVAFESAGSASFDVSTLSAEAFTATVGLDTSSEDTAKAKFFVEADGKQIAASSELSKGKLEKLAAAVPSGTKTVTLKTEGDGIAVFGDAAVTFPFSHSGYVDMTSLLMQQQINDSKNPLKTNSDIKIGSESFDKGFAVYPQHDDNAGYVSELYFDVSGINAKTFSAKIGLNNAANTGGVIFRLYADGQKVYESDVMDGKTPAKDISADISGANLLTLTVYDNGDNAGDNAVWANPRLSLDAEGATHLQNFRTMSLTELDWKSAVSESKNPQINKPYQDGADYKINVGGIEYNYGISAHPYNNSTPSSISYDLTGYNFNYFTVKVGKTKESKISTTDQTFKEKFLIYGDGKLLCESEPITMGHYTELSADVTGVKILTISIDACGNYGWGACAWCEPTLYYGVEEGEIRITSPLKEIERTVAGNQNLDVTGFVLGVEKVKGLVNGKFIGTAEVQSDGTFTLTVKARNLELGRNTLTISPLNAEGKSAETVVVKENKINVVSVPWDSTAGDIITKGGSLTSRCDKLSIGSQVHQTNNGFCVKPGETEEDYADVVIDLTTLGSKMEYFHALVGLDDFAPLDYYTGGSVKYQVLDGEKVLAETEVLSANQTAPIFCDIPSTTKKLTLRVSNGGDGNYVDYADWLYASLYFKKTDYGMTDKDLYSDNNLGGNTEISAVSQVGVRFSVEKPFSAVTLSPESAADTVTGSLYKFVYSYKRSLQGEALSSVTATKGADGKYVFELNKEYDAGEYVFAADGVTSIKANGSQYGYYYTDGVAHRGLINMSLRFGGKYDSYLSAVTPEPETVNAGTNHATAAEKERAERTYKEMITNLENFPSKMTIGDDSYVGFGSSDFTLKSTDVTEDKVTKSVNTTFTLEHKSGLEFELRCVYYPDYAAFDWVIYFTNNGEENSPIVSDISPAELTFKGDNPTILSNFSDGGQYAPFLPQRLELKEGEKKTFAPSTGRSTEDAFPYYNFEYGNKGAFVVTSWSGQWQADFEYNNGVTAFSGRQQTFSSYLKPGETARTPLTAMVLYDGRDTDRATNLWRNWFIDCNMYKNDGENPTEPFVAGVTSAVYNEMENATEANQIACIEKYLQNNVQINVWWMDAGWYIGVNDGNNRSSWAHVGNWAPDENRFPTKFKAISDYANERNVDTLLWFEPERIAISDAEYANQPDSEYRVKPEWLIGYGDAQGQLAYGGNGSAYQLDLGNKEALDWLCKRVLTILEEGGLSIYREDLNIVIMADNWRQTNEAHPDRAGMSENGCVQGHYEYWDAILSLPQIKIIDSCASGGHRLDLETMRRAVALHPTDYSYNDLSAKQIGTYGLASWFPFAGANTGVGGYVTSTSKYIIRSAYRQALILQYDVNVLSKEYFEIAENCVNEWNGIKKYFYDDLYQLTKSTTGFTDWYSYEYLSEENQEGFALVFRRSDKAERTQSIKLKGLHAEDTYEITFADSEAVVTATGAELMSAGVTLTLDEDEGGVDSEVIYIRRTNSVAGDRGALESAISSARALVEKSLVNEGYTGISAFELICAYEKALAVYENEGESEQNINAAAKALSAAIDGLEKGAVGSKEEIENIIGSIGEINEQNYLYRKDMIDFVKALVEKSGVTPANADLLKTAEEQYNSLANAGKPGDTDGDGEITVTDALLALQGSVGKITLSPEAQGRADVDGDGKITVTDSLLILQRAVVKIDKFPVEK